MTWFNVGMISVYTRNVQLCATIKNHPFVVSQIAIHCVLMQVIIKVQFQDFVLFLLNVDSYEYYLFEC